MSHTDPKAALYDGSIMEARMNDPLETGPIRRGDTVRTSDGEIVRVVSTSGGYIHTTNGTYGSWQVVKVGTTPR